MPMVKYWRTGQAAQAKVTTLNGQQVMWIEGEKYPFPAFPRGWLLFGSLSKLKHEIKNQIFNNSWAKLDKGEKIADYVRSVLPNLYPLYESLKMDVLPIEKMATPVQELHRAWNSVAPRSVLKDMVTFILQEDDSYRWRLQWMVSYFGRGKPVEKFKRGLDWLEQAEVIGDMKERVRLFKRVFLALMSDYENRKLFDTFFRECDWEKLKLGEAEKYFFRAKYFKVDLDKFDY